jgi:serine/threonine protein kinase
VKHENIINLVEIRDRGVYYNKKGKMRELPYVVLELAQGGEIYEYIAVGGPLPESICRSYFH